MQGRIIRKLYFALCHPKGEFAYRLPFVELFDTTAISLQKHGVDISKLSIARIENHVGLYDHCFFTILFAIAPLWSALFALF
jgi:hypothetical protein